MLTGLDILVTNTFEQLLINAFLNLWSFLCAITSGFVCERVGRRPLFIISTAGMLLAFTLQTICSAQYALHQNHNAGNAVVAFICGYPGPLLTRRPHDLIILFQLFMARFTAWRTSL